MLTTHPSSIVQKRDLHVGGLGSSVSGALAAVASPASDRVDSLLGRARVAAQEAEHYLREMPWATVAVAAAAGAAAGYLLSRRSRS